jgi:RNA polymerase sigma-70 factor (ECF subfamily)
MSRPIDRHAVDQLVVEHLPAALRLAMRLTGDANLAEDVVQETLCRVLARWQSFRGEAAFRTWMLQIVVNVDRDRRRRRRRRESVDLRMVGIESVHAGPNEHASVAELSENIRAAIQRLPDRQREVALLSLGEGLEVAEVAHILEISPANVHTCIHLARKRIAKAIGVDYAPET